MLVALAVRRWFAVFALLLGVAWVNHVYAEVAVPPLTSPVTDLANALTPEQQATLRTLLLDYEQRRGTQVAVLVVPTTQPEALEQYSIRVVEQWKLGRAKVDDGVLLLIAKDDRAMRIEAGYGLEGVLTDAVTNRIIRNVIAPRFREGDYYQGINDGLVRIMAVADGEALPAADRDAQHAANGRDAPWPLLLFGVFAAGGILRAMLGRLPAALLSSALVGGAIVWFVGSWSFALIAGLFVFVSVLAGSAGQGWNSNGRSGTYGGGWGGGFGGGGGGGWSGGGGGFGGGGSSGRW